MNVYLQIMTDQVRIINEEVISLPETKIKMARSLPITNRILMDDKTQEFLGESYTSEPVPEVIIRQSDSIIKFFELLCPYNFLIVAEKILEKLEQEEQGRLQREIELEEDIKKQKESKKSPATIAFAQALDDITRTLKKDLNEVNKYVQMRTTDRVLISNIEKMITTIYKRFFVEKSKLFSDIEK